MFLALREEERQVECFWPMPLERGLTAPPQGQLATTRKTPAADRPLPPG